MVGLDKYAVVVAASQGPVAQLLQLDRNTVAMQAVAVHPAVRS